MSQSPFSAVVAIAGLATGGAINFGGVNWQNSSHPWYLFAAQELQLVPHNGSSSETTCRPITASGKPQECAILLPGNLRRHNYGGIPYCMYHEIIPDFHEMMTLTRNLAKWSRRSRGEARSLVQEAWCSRQHCPRPSQRRDSQDEWRAICLANSKGSRRRYRCFILERGPGCGSERVARCRGLCVNDMELCEHVRFTGAGGGHRCLSDKKCQHSEVASWLIDDRMNCVC